MEWKSFTESSSKYRIAYSHVGAASNCPRYHVILTAGRGQPTWGTERNRKLIQERLNHGADVWLLDWQGQGLSERTIPDEPFKHHLQFGYDMHVSTIKQFIEEIVPCRLPLVLMSHSMGSHIVLRYLAEQRNKVSCAVLTAPMLRIRTTPFPEKLTFLTCRLAYSLGLGHLFAPGQKSFWRQSNLHMGGVTYGWLYQSLQSCSEISQKARLGYWRRLTTPVLIQTCPTDETVYHETIVEAASSMPAAELIITPESGHDQADIAVETNRFIDKCISKGGP